MVVTTERFTELTVESARTLGAPNPRVVAVGHPLGGTDEETILAWADAAVEETLRQFTNPD